MKNIKSIYKLLAFAIIASFVAGLSYYGYLKIIEQKNNLKNNIPKGENDNFSVKNSFIFPDIDKKSLVNFIKKNEFGEDYIDQEIVRNLIYNLILNSNISDAQLDFDFVQRSDKEIEVYIEVNYKKEKYHKVYEIKI
ncbi:hypothetical protein JXZ92_02845 [Mycoplasma sp. CSL10137]|uniref:MHO_1590 family protein n=1 Tax=unclassified Mycoplasma TaxID=2683645 RepID=UPI00197C8084|nr:MULTISPECIES: hypothetical protein [unclassified Mycoplasma]MBN4083739.1 hypothetical protein [Mycoplasma sp. CSL10137]MBN4084629.1 hypothetical protein [Mycoplasma sp. CSL10166]MBU4693107.1 hypothetical protein [Mycoplasma sp. CSL7491-lung]